jgi:hypothetical protein
LHLAELENNFLDGNSQIALVEFWQSLTHIGSMGALDFAMLIALIAIPIVGLAARSWVKKYVETTIQKRADSDIERLRSELRSSEEHLKAELKLNEAEIAALRSGALTTRSSRQQLRDQRLFEAIEDVWQSVQTLNSLKGSAAMFAMFKVEAFESRTPNEPKLRQFLETISGDIDLKDRLSQLKSENSKPFVTPLCWALFSAYRAILINSAIHLEILKVGIEESGKMMDQSSIKKTLLAVLPHQAAYIEKNTPNVYFYLLDEVENLLISEIRAMMDGIESDTHDLEKSKRIMAAIRPAATST